VSLSPRRTTSWPTAKPKGSRGGRPPHFDAETYRERNVVERAFNRLKGWRGIATRYYKNARNDRAGVIVASIVLLWLTDPSDTP
jgi:transposase